MTTTAFVLSGGGAKGSFSAGALDYLVREKKLAPDIITGTSPGAICAAVLAQARGQQELFTVAVQLRDDIVRMSVAGASFVPQDWLAGLADTSLGSDIDQLIAGKSRPPIPADPTLDTDVLADIEPLHLTARRGWDDLRALATKVGTTHRALKDFTAHSQSVLRLDPLGDAFAGRTPGQGPAPLDTSAIARPGLELRLAVTALNAGRTHYVDQNGVLLDSDAATPIDGVDAPGVVEGVLSSASVPMVFAARSMGNDVYVDGGVLDNVPLEAASSLGAGDVYVVLAGLTDCPPPTEDYATADMFTVALRAESTVAYHDQERRSLATTLPGGVRPTVIGPVIPVVGTFETHPGLLTINMDYGWLRACAATASPSTTDLGGLADRIAIGRTRAWYLEEGAAGSGADVDTALASAKKLVGDAVAAWKATGEMLPPHAEDWSTRPELHAASSSDGH